MKKMIMLILLASTSSAFASLPKGSVTLSKKDSLSLLQSYHEELVDPDCVSKTILNSPTNKANFAMGMSIASIATSYEYSDGGNYFEAHLNFDHDELLAQSTYARCKLK